MLSMDAQATEKGMAIVEEILRAWANETKRQKVDGNGNEEDGIIALKDLVAQYKDRATSDPWIQKALECL